MDLAQLVDDVEEVSQGYARRHGITRDAAWFLLKLQEEVGELTQTFLMRTRQARNKGYSAQEIEERFRGELADVVCHALLLAHHNGIELEEAIERKWLAWKLDSTAAVASQSNG